MTRLLQLAVFLSALLLFAVQPLAGKIVLPVLGGSPAVWSTCIVFFQTMLLVGYLYAHLLTTRLTKRSQKLVHGIVLLGAGLMLPMTVALAPPGPGAPQWWLFATLARNVGPAFFALAATAPLALRWFSSSSDPRAKNPYFLYAASNAGSLAGLVGYLAIEPLATRSTQSVAWAIGYVVVAVSLAAFPVASAPQPAPRKAAKPRAEASENRQGTPRPAFWLVLALVPSMLLVGVTQHLATDVASVPFLWVVPLVLYLITYIAAFSERRVGSSSAWGRVGLFLIFPVLALSLAEVRYPIVPVLLAHLALFGALVMSCHVRLAETRPDPKRVTGFLLCMAAGGALGSATASLAAPLVFASVLEYPLAIGAALFLLTSIDSGRAPSSARWAWSAAALFAGAIGYWGLSTFDRSGRRM